MAAAALATIIVSAITGVSGASSCTIPSMIATPACSYG